ncbi:MAG TPA: hypothetical protein VIM79_02885 [Niastella sp.]
MTLQPNADVIKQYTFTKENLNDPATNTYNSLQQKSVYKIIDNEGNIAAQFYYLPAKQFIQIDGKEITVSVIEKFLKKTQYLLMENNRQVGEYKFIHSGLCHFWQDVPSDPNGAVTLNDMIYNFRRIPSGIRSLQFKKETWGHFKFRLYAVYGDAYAQYTFRIDQLSWLRTGFINHHPFSGAIETNSENLLVVVAAFYLMERVLATTEETDTIQ